MVVQPRDFLEVARLLDSQTPQPTEGCIRSGVSRAYYCAFLESREQARCKGILKPNVVRIKHGELIRKLKASSDTRISDLGQQLQSFYADRERADYDLTASVQPGALKGAILLAELFEQTWGSI